MSAANNKIDFREIFHDNDDYDDDDDNNECDKDVACKSHRILKRLSITSLPICVS